MSITNEYKSFEQLSSEIGQFNEKLKSTVRNTDSDKTLAGIQRRLQDKHRFLSNERNDLENQINANKAKYNDRFVEENRVALIQKFDEMANAIVTGMKTEVRTLFNAKMEKISTMLSTAPTEDQLRLLQTLQMRGDIDTIEIHHILPVFFENYQGMRVLQAVGEQNGITLRLPVQLDCRTLYDTLTESTEYLLRACDELPKKDNKIRLEYVAFFKHNEKEPNQQYDPLYQEYINMFDNIPQLRECKTEKTALSPTEKARVDWYFREVATLDPTKPGDDTTILNKVSEVIENNPDMAELLPYSKYKDYVSALELIKAEQEK